MQVLIGKREVKNKIRLEFTYDSGQFRYVVSIHLCYLDVSAVFLLDSLLNCLALGESPACDHYFCEDFRDLRAFVHSNGRDTSSSDNHYSSAVIHSTHKRCDVLRQVSDRLAAVVATFPYACKSMSISLATFEAEMEETRVVS